MQNTKQRIWGAFCGVLGFASVGFAQDQMPSRFVWDSFGLAGRFTTQNNHSGVNFSVLPYWSPKYRVHEHIHLEGLLGGTVMDSNKGNFWSTQAQLGVSFHKLFAESLGGKDRFVPEFLLGIEDWAVKGGGTYLVMNTNLHYRFHFEANRFLRTLDSVYVGYQHLFNSPRSARQYLVGLTFTPFTAGKRAAVESRFASDENTNEASAPEVQQ